MRPAKTHRQPNIIGTCASEGLEIAAGSSCHFCTLLVACLKGYPDNGCWIEYDWEGEGCNPAHSLLATARQLPQSEVRLCILSDDSDHKAAFSDVKVLDSLLVQIGPHDESGFDIDDGIKRCPAFKLTLASSRGTRGKISCSGIQCPFTESLQRIKRTRLPWGVSVLDDMRWIGNSTPKVTWRSPKTGYTRVTPHIWNA